MLGKHYRFYRVPAIIGLNEGIAVIVASLWKHTRFIYTINNDIKLYRIDCVDAIILT